DNLCDAQSMYLTYYMREYILKQYKDRPDILWRKIAEILLFADRDIYCMEADLNMDRILHEAFAKSPHANMEIGRASELINIIKEARLEAIKKMALTEKRSRTLNEQIKGGYFMIAYENIMETIQKCKEDPLFISSLRMLELPENENIQEHILYIFCIRIDERQKQLTGENREAARKELIQDNLDTISFFRLAELIVQEAFQKVRHERIRQCVEEGGDVRSVQRDINNSDYLLVEIISRIIYKYVNESPKMRHDYREALKYYYEDHPFLVELQRHIAEELVHKSFQSEEYWKVKGANPAEGHVGLVEKCVLPAEEILYCIVDYDKYSTPMNRVISVIENNYRRGR
ncbi:MAG: hypothetical protein D6828_02240, partial [Nitrospirae bacterium]